MGDIQESIDSAKDWLLTSSVQTLNNLKGTSFFGSFSSWFDLDKQMYPFVYSEITGYGITTLLFLNHLKTDPSLIKRAEFAARWLNVITSHKNGGFKCVISHEDNSFKYKEGQTYTFDAGMILHGLVNLYRSTNNKQYLNASQSIVSWFKTMMTNSGEMNALYDIEKDEIINSDESWSTQPGCFLAKNAIGLLNLHEVTKDESAKEMAIKICDAALKKQDPSGRFICHRSNHTNIHPHSYTAEGLLCAGLYLNEKKYLESAARATEWVLKNQKDGALPRLFLNEGNYNQRVDGIAQTIRLATILMKKGYLSKEYQGTVDLLVQKLLSFQYKNKDLNQEGGFLFGFSSDGKELKNVNSWCTMFALQALEWYKRDDVPNDEVVKFFI